MTPEEWAEWLKGAAKRIKAEVDRSLPYEPQSTYYDPHDDGALMRKHDRMAAGRRRRRGNV